MLHPWSKSPAVGHHLFWAIGIVGLLGCQEHKVTAFNSEPVATITSHTEGDQLVEGTPEMFSGMVSDDDDRVDELATTWRIGEREVCVDVVPDMDGVTACEITLLGEDIPADDDAVSVTLTVSDPRSANHTARVVLDPEPNLPPEIEIFSPTDGVHHYADETITFHGSVSDAEDHETDLLVWWESSLEGALSFATDITDEGTVINTSFLGVGQHTISLMAEDSGGATTVESVNVLVKAENSPPSCAISTPTEDQVFEHNTAVSFSGVATDPDVTPGELTILWESDRDGILNETTPLSDGTMDFVLETLSAGDHRVQLSVFDERDLDCTASVDFSVRKPPTVESFAPDDGSIVTQGQDITMSATVQDREDDPPEGLLVEWTSDLHPDAPLGSAATNAMGSASIEATELVPGDHLITITVTDSDGMTGSTHFSLLVNQPPTRPEISLSPDPATTLDDLVTNIDVESIDPEGAPVSYRYTWSREGEESLLSTSDLFPSEGTTKGQRWTITVTPNDGDTDGPAATASVDVLNTAPTLASVTIAPDRPATTDTITCSAGETSDDDGDSVAVSYRWFVNDAVIDANTATIGADWFSAFDLVHCEATPSDEDDDGAALRSDTVQINTPPTAADASISPSTPTGDEVLTCIAGATSDIDGDEVEVQYRWFVDDRELGEDSDTLDSGFFKRDEVVACSITPHDGIESGDTVRSDAVTIVNSFPIAAGVTISPPIPLTTDTLTCVVASTTDGDGDAVSIDRRWLINGAYIETTLSSLAPTEFNPGDSIICEAIPNDGTDSGAPARSEPVNINKLPTVNDVTITPVEPTGADDLLCNHGPPSDLDGDGVEVGFRWFVNDIEVLVPDDALPASFIKRDDEVVCWAIPNDGKEDGLARSSDPVDISNAAPTITGMVLRPPEPMTTDALECTATETSDGDGDSVVVNIDWFINGEATAFTGNTLGPEQHEPGDSIKCEGTPNDGTTSGGAVPSDSVKINLLPTVGEVTITPNNPLGTDDLLCSHGPTSDLDGHPVTVTHRWFVNDIEIDHDGETLSEIYISRDDEVLCQVTPNDGFEDGTARSSATKTILNTTPTLANAEVSPSTPKTTDTLTCLTAGAADTDDDTVSVNKVWVINDTPTEFTGDTLGPEQHDPGDAIVCEATPNDGTDNGAVALSEKVSINVPPTVGTVTLSPSAPTGADDLLCSHGPTSDLDGHTVGVRFHWFVNGIEIDADGDTLSESFISREDEVSCSATPNDGLEDGATRSSTTKTVLNAPPTVAGVMVTPSAPKTTDTLTCAAEGASDADGDAVSISKVWIVNDTPIDHTGDTLGPGQHEEGDSIKCEGTPNDGTDNGAAVLSDPVKINTKPTVSMAYISPVNPSGADDVTCHHSEPSDLDGHTVTMRYRWFVGETELGETTDTLSSAFFVRDDGVRCAVVPNDGLEDGEGAESDPITILNAPPSIATVVLSPEDPLTTDTLTCATSGIEDGDGDMVELDHVWTINGTASTETGSTLAATEFASGAIIGCTVTPTDGTASGVAVSSETIQVNSLPTVLGVAITPPDAKADDALTCTETLASDTDGDAVTTSTRWLLNGVTTGVTGDTLDAGYRRGDAVVCEITPFDGREYGEPMQADIEIQNTPPIITDLGVTPAEPSTDTALVASATATDADVLDAPTINYIWRVNGVDIGVSGATLDGTVHFERGDEVQVVATATDGTTESEPALSAIVTIGNSPPTIPEVSITPAEPAAGAQDLVCTIVNPALDDDDDDVITYSFAWTVDGATYEYAESWGAHAGDTVPGFATSDGEAWTCTVTATDGEASTTSETVSVTPITKFVGWGTDPVDIDDWSTTLYGTNNGEKAGTALANAGDVNDDGHPDLLVGAPYYKNGSTTGAGRAYLALYSETASPYLNDAYRIYEGETQSLFGYSLSGHADLSGTGLPDVAVGAPQYDSHDNADGLVAVYFDGGSDLDGPLGVDDADVLLVGESNGDQAGFSVSFVPNMTDDGKPELLVGAPYEDKGGTNAGAAYLVPSELLLTSDEIDLDHGDVKFIEGESGKDRAGSQVKAAGDIDGDGITELLISATHYGGAYAGRVYVVSGDDVVSAAILVDLENADHIFKGEAGHDNAGAAIDGDFDADGDGKPDILIGAPHPSYEDDTDDALDDHPAGRAYVIFGRSLPGIDVLTLDGANVTIECDTENCAHTDTQQSLGASVSGASDVDDDGFADVLVGAPNYRTSHKQAGAVALFFGDSITEGGTFGIAGADAMFHGRGTNNYAGSAVVGMGDIDGDGWEDFIVGERGEGAGASNGGMVHTLLSPGS